MWPIPAGRERNMDLSHNWIPLPHNTAQFDIWYLNRSWKMSYAGSSSNLPLGHFHAYPINYLDHMFMRQSDHSGTAFESKILLMVYFWGACALTRHSAWPVYNIQREHSKQDTQQRAEQVPSSNSKITKQSSGANVNIDRFDHDGLWLHRFASWYHA